MTHNLPSVAMPLCDYVWEGYPDPGCAEFGPPDRYECKTVATARIIHSCPADGQDHVMTVCDEHVNEFLGDDTCHDLVKLDYEWYIAYRLGSSRADATTLTFAQAIKWMAEEDWWPPIPDTREGYVRGFRDRWACRCYEALGDEMALVAVRRDN